jgi:VWFA-related protein
MKKFLPSFALALAFVAPVYSQDTKPAPRPTPPADNDVVKISTNLIQIDVSVTDAKGKPIADLKPEEIEIYENGEKQKITNFSFVSARKTVTEKTKPVDKDAIPIPQTALRPEQIRRTIALIVDDLSLSFESAYYTRRALKRFVDEQMQDGDLVAIVRTGSGIGALQQFTSDKRMLYAAIEKVKWNPMGTAGISAFAPIEATPLETLVAAGNDTVTEEQIQEEKDRMNAFNDFRSSTFVTGTLGALQYIVTGMSELPGRKSVILFSDGFRLFERDNQGFESSGRVMEFMRQLVDLANRSSVVFYTVDPRGLQTLGLSAADNTGGMTVQSMNAAISERRDQLFETQSALSYLARETGGFAVLNNNDLSPPCARGSELLSRGLRTRFGNLRPHKTQVQQARCQGAKKRCQCSLPQRIFQYCRTPKDSRKSAVVDDANGPASDSPRFAFCDKRHNVEAQYAFWQQRTDQLIRSFASAYRSQRS